MIDPWFLGRGERGLTPKRAAVVLGSVVSLAVTQKGQRHSSLKPAILAALGKLKKVADTTVVDGRGRLAPKYYIGTRGIGWVLPYEGAGSTPGGEHIIPVALYNQRETLILVPNNVELSKGLVRSKGAAEIIPMISRSLPTGLDRAQQEDGAPPGILPEPGGGLEGEGMSDGARLALAAAGGVALLAGVAGAAYALM